MSEEEGTVPAGTPVPDFRKEGCPHCDEWIWESRVDEHIDSAHADMPPCNATYDTESLGTYTCVLRAGHELKPDTLYDRHLSALVAGSRFVWNDRAEGATPHHSGAEETRD